VRIARLYRLYGFCAVILCVAVPPGSLHVTAQAATSSGGYAPTFELGGDVQHPGIVTRDMLRRYPPTTVDVAFVNGATAEQGAFTGALLWNLVQTAGLIVTPGLKNGALRKYIVVTGSDGYQVVLALAEILPQYGGQPVLIAYQRDGKSLGPDQGMARLIVPNDKRGGRDVNNIIRVVVRGAE